LRSRGLDNLTQDRSIPMTEQAISPLRRRMIEDMSIRKFAAKTQHDYVQRVKDFATFLGRSPGTAEAEDVRRFRLHLTANGAGTPKINATVAALRFFFKVTLDRPDLTKHLSFIHEPRKPPVVLSPDEVARFLEAAPGIKYKAALSVAYGAGLRVSEVVSLKVSDIDSKRMMLRVEQGKGRKDRYAMLSPVLLELLRDWYRIARPQGWLFPGQNPVNPMTTRQLTRACHAAAQMAEITKRVTPHTLRHSFATHLLEHNIDVRVIQVLLGHAKLDTTALYTRVATNTIREVMSPLDRLTPLLPKKDETKDATKQETKNEAKAELPA
jgi:integrase/recombinase XerD